MRNMRISKKLTICFAIVIALSFTVGATGIISMHQMNLSAEEMFDDQTAPMYDIAHTVEYIWRLYAQMRNAVIYNGQADRLAAVETEIRHCKDSFEESAEVYRLTISSGSPEERLFNEAMNAYTNSYYPALAEILEKAKTGVNQDELIALVDQTGVTANLIVSNLTECMEILVGQASDTHHYIDDLYFSSLIVIAGVMLFVAAVSFLMSRYVSGLISNPLNALSVYMKKAGSTGDITLNQEENAKLDRYGEAKDEIGQTIASVGAFVEHVIHIAEELESLADGDLTTEIEVLTDTDTMGISVMHLSDNLNKMFFEIQTASVQVSTGAQQIADGAQSLAQGSTEQAATVQELSASTSEIAEKTKENANMANKAAALAGTIKSNAEKGSRQMDEMMDAVNEINHASQSISKVIKVIDDIAFQTNILALNAAVEAARAGQHGKGFAVVADEVRNLAAKSAAAAKDTGELISNSMEKAKHGASIAGNTTESLKEIVTGINESSEIIMKIAKSSETQTAGITQIHDAIDQVAQVIQQNSATAEESAAASQELSGQSAMLEDLIAQFKLKNVGPASGVRANSAAPMAGIYTDSNTTAFAYSSDAGKY